jgi:LacI family transcriptional regulator
MKVTIRHVAKKAGVSATTVSRVLNSPDLVDAQTRERVRNAMEVLDFHPNAIARGLSSQRVDTIGVVVPGINDLFFDELYRGIEQASRQNQMKVLLFDTQHDQRRVKEGLIFLKQHQVGGIIFTSRFVDEDLDPVLARLGIPLVLALTEAGGKTPLPGFKVDDVKATFDITSYLISRGHRRIGMITGEEIGDRTSMLRHQGYQRALQHYDIAYDEDWVTAGDYRFDGGYAAMRKLLESHLVKPLTAVVAASDEMAIGAMRCLYDNGFHVPADISVVGFDDLGIAKMMIPSLTTVAQPFVTIGEEVTMCLLKIIDSKGHYNPSGTYYLPHKLVERESVRTV